MGVPVMVMGFSGSGKSTSLRNFGKDEIGVFSVAGKRMPFKSDFNAVNMEKLKFERDNFNPYQYMMAAIKSAKPRSYAIDDSQYLMAFEEMDSTKTGFDKFNALGFNFIGLVRFIRSQVDDDKIVYFLHHAETDENGRIKPKTIGKLIDNHFTLEGMFEITIMAEFDKGEYVFNTTTDGFTPFKNPMGMLEPVIPNDLAAVDDAIRGYWGMEPRKAAKDGK